MIIIAIRAVVAGADTYEQIENFGKKHYKWLSKFLHALTLAEWLDPGIG